MNDCDTTEGLSTGIECEPTMQIGPLDLFLTNTGEIHHMLWDTFSPILAREYVRTCYGDAITDQYLDHLTYNQCVHLLMDDIQKHIDDEDPPQSLEMLCRLIDLDEIHSPDIIYRVTRIQSNSRPELVALRWALGYFKYQGISRKKESDLIESRVGQSINIPNKPYPFFLCIVWGLTKERILYLNNLPTRSAFYNPHCPISPTQQTGLSDTDPSYHLDPLHLEIQ